MYSSRQIYSKSRLGQRRKHCKKLDVGFVEFNNEWRRYWRLRCLRLHEAAFLLLLLRVLNRLQWEHLFCFHFEELLKKFIDVGALLGRRFDVFALPHSLQFPIYFVFSFCLDCYLEGFPCLFWHLPLAWNMKSDLYSLVPSNLPASSSHLLPTSIIGNPSRPPFT